MLNPFVLRREFESERLRLTRENVKLANELSAVRGSAHGAEQANAKEMLRLNERLIQSSSLAAAKQNEIAMLRAELDRTNKALDDERMTARTERQKLMDWIAKGLSGGPPIFADPPPVEVEPAKPEPAPKPTTDRIPTVIEEAVNRVGRNPRLIVKHITKQNDKNFEAEMMAAGVKRTFDDDRAEAEAEATVLAESKTS